MKSTKAEGEVACQKCGSTYSVTSARLPAKDQDFFKCEVCGHEINRWNSTTVPSYKLVKRGTPPK